MNKDKRPFIELSKEERKQKSRKLLFGDFKDEYLGNIWGKKFTIFSFFGLLLVGGFALFGIYTGKIDVNKLDKENPSFLMKNVNPHTVKLDSVNKNKQKKALIE